MMLRFLSVVLLALFALPASAADPILIRFSYVIADDTPKGRAALRFKLAAERRTNGQVLVDIYPNSTLYKDGEEMEALMAGKVEIIAPSLSKFSPLGLTEFEVFDLPYIFPSRGMLRRVTDGPVGQGLLKKLETKGITGLAYWDNGFKVMSANTPLRKPTDLKGLKMRIQNSRVIDAQMRTLGALAVPMAFSEVIGALKNGTVDGTENPPSNLYSSRMYELQKHVTVSNHGYLGYAVIANKKFWDGLPDSIRLHLKLAMFDATRYANLYAEQDNTVSMSKIRAAGKSEIYELSADEREEWRKKLMPVHREMESRIGKELIQAVYKEGAAVGHKF
jgi:C4-dicarboxylate-binding protein DctP